MKRIWIVGLVLLYLGLRAAGAALAPARDTDLEMFFLPSAKIALAGRPLHLYEVRLDVYPNANGPLGMVPLTLVAAIAERLGVLDERLVFRVMIALAFSLFPLLLAREAVPCSWARSPATVVRTHHRSWTPRWSLTINLATLAVLALVLGWLHREHSARDEGLG